MQNELHGYHSLAPPSTKGMVLTRTPTSIKAIGGH